MSAYSAALGGPRRALLSLQDTAITSLLRLWSSSSLEAVRVLTMLPASPDDETTQTLCRLGGNWTGGTVQCQECHDDPACRGCLQNEADDRPEVQELTRWEQ